MKYCLSILVFAVLFMISSCKKYEDGPALSLQTKKARLENTWRVDSYFLNGNDETFSYRVIVTEEELGFSKSGSFTYSEVSSWSWAKAEDSGSWDFVNKKEDLKMTSVDGTSKTYRILKLMSDQLWLERQVTPDSLVEIHYVSLLK